uniref:SH3 domain-containing YSC84-like protein 1 n=1 Tax=Lygus hesperus TaxID=30085 RepID=A0A0A9XW31_LYGHE
MHRLRASHEFVLQEIVITDAMRHMYDTLLDSTPHPHMLTNAFKLDSRASMYTGEARQVPHSPLQMRLDLELNKFRRMQREEGVVKVPPASWSIDTSSLVPYKLNAAKQVTN